MMKSWILFILMSLPVGLAHVYAGESDSLSRKQEVIVVKKDFNKQQKAGQFELNVSYPVIENNAYPITHDFNLNVQRIIGDAIHDFQSKVEQIHRKDKGVDGLSVLNLDYATYFQYKEVLSIKFIKSTQYVGSPSPIDLYLSLNYDLKTSRIIRIEDIFNPYSGYAQIITDMVNAQVKDCKLKEESVFRNFSLDDQAFIVTLDDQARNLKKCNNEVRINWKDIAHLLAENGVAQEIMSKRSP
jgi:hypothetical protein